MIILEELLGENRFQKYNIFKNIFLNFIPNRRMFPIFWNVTKRPQASISPYTC